MSMPVLKRDGGRWRRCPLCENYDPELMANLIFAHGAKAILPATYHVVVCRKCGFVYDDVDVGVETFEKYYAASGKYAQRGIGGSGDISRIDRLRYEGIVKFIEPVLRLGPGFVSIADVGCGKGGLLRVFKEHGYIVLHGFDPSPACVAMLREQHGIPATRMGITDLGRVRKKFDLVVVSNVFEHLFNFHDAIDAVDNVLKDGGLVYVDVPDASRYHRCFYAPYYSFDMEHINHFNVATMMDAWARHGYECIKTEELFGTPVPGRRVPMCRMLVRKNKCLVKKRGEGPASGVRRFVKKSRSAEKLLETRQIPDGCYYWGWGAYAKWLKNRFAGTPLGSPEIIFDAGVIKSFAERINGIPLVKVSEMKKVADMCRPMVITSVLYERQILAELQKMGWKGPIYSGATGVRKRFR